MIGDPTAASAARASACWMPRPTPSPSCCSIPDAGRRRRGPRSDGLTARMWNQIRSDAPLLETPARLSTDLGRAVLRQARPAAQRGALDRIGEMDLGDRVVAALDPYAMALHQHVGVGAPRGRLEAVGRELDQEAERVGEVDRSMKPRSLTPLCRIPRSSRRCTACWKVARDTANARWCTAPLSVEVRVGSGRRPRR